MPTDRVTIRRQALREVGGLTAPIDIVATAVVTAETLQHRLDGGDRAIQNWRAAFPDGPAAAADIRRGVASFVAATGAATLDSGFNVDPSAADVMELYPPESWSYDDFNDAIDHMTDRTRRAVALGLPALANQRYSLRDFDWVRNREDVIAVVRSSNPNLLTNADFRNWPNGVALAPHGWALSGAGGTVAQAAVSAAPVNADVVALTRGSADTFLTQTLRDDLYLDLLSENGAIGVWALASAASVARIGVSFDAGATFAQTAFHTGGGGWEYLETTTVVPAAQSDLSGLQVQIGSEGAGNPVAHYANPALVRGTVVAQTLQERGDAGYEYERIAPKPHIIAQGNLPTIVLVGHTVPRANQLVVWTKQPLPRPTSDTAPVYEMDLQVAVAGAIVQLVEDHPARVTMDRRTALMARWGPIYARGVNAMQHVRLPDVTRSRALVKGL